MSETMHHACYLAGSVMSENHVHYFPDDLNPIIREAAIEGKLTGPMFIGQGLTRRSGSDSYGAYVLSIGKTKTGKPLVGIGSAKSEFHGSWTEGSQDCSIDLCDAQPDVWLTTYGHWPNGLPKWWYCDEHGDRKAANLLYTGRSRYNWNGAYAYQDPSF